MYQFFHSHILLSISFISILLIASYYELYYIFYKDIIYINSEDVVPLLNTFSAIVFDFRDKDVYFAQHIATSVNIDSNKIDFNYLKKKYYNKKIIIINNQKLSKRKLIKLLLNEGFSDIYFLKNGILDWSKNGFLLVTKKS